MSIIFQSSPSEGGYMLMPSDLALVQNTSVITLLEIPLEPLCKLSQQEISLPHHCTSLLTKKQKALRFQNSFFIWFPNELDIFLKIHLQSRSPRRTSPSEQAYHHYVHQQPPLGTYSKQALHCQGCSDLQDTVPTLKELVVQVEAKPRYNTKSAR